jgi:hypothetical protein
MTTARYDVSWKRHCDMYVSTTSNVQVSEDFFPFIITILAMTTAFQFRRYNGKDICMKYE